MVLAFSCMSVNAIMFRLCVRKLKISHPHKVDN